MSSLDPRGMVLGGFEFGFGVDKNNMCNDVKDVFPRNLFDCCTQMLERDAHFVCIELCPAFMGIIFNDELYQFAADFLFSALHPYVLHGNIAV